MIEILAKTMIRLLLILSFLSLGFSIDITSGGKLSKNQLGVDVRHYDIRLKIDPKRKMISGYVDIKIKVIDEVRFIELDLLNQYFISNFVIFCNLRFLTSYVGN